ncbi:C4b-binding protein alpha chain-like isoform X2 [Polypterus senegalus]|uniref:C4b-binding protein alpha chain-like isoform X2 n=1 Tax=Polypterus senegalus TaxID=55291 RepID=UPI001964D292|nr:C4b-binding protein alpha chain-like isoform X2 [Polypterus senegalus]
MKAVPCVFGGLIQLLLVLGLVGLVAGNCGTPPSVTNAVPKFDLMGDYSDGFKLSYECIPGYVREQGSYQITCSGSTWSSPTLKCKRKDCGSPPELFNGHYETNEGTEFGATITAVCSEGYVLGGRDNRLTCGADGMWYGGSPVCDRVKCQDPPEIENGSHNPENGIVSGSVVTYKCIPELDLIGIDRIVCDNNGEYNSQPPECKKVSCDNINVVNGQKTSGFGPSYRYKNSITFTCNMGFQLKGPSTIVCDENNRWKPDPPTCVKESGTVSPPTTTASPSGNKTGVIVGSIVGGIIAIVLLIAVAVAVKKYIIKKNSSAKDNRVL